MICDDSEWNWESEKLVLPDMIIEYNKSLEDKRYPRSQRLLTAIHQNIIEKWFFDQYPGDLGEYLVAIIELNIVTFDFDQRHDIAKKLASECLGDTAQRPFRVFLDQPLANNAKAQ